MDWISYRSLANLEVVTPLFADYMTQFQKLDEHFSGNYTDHESWRTKMQTLSEQRYDRALLRRVLSSQNREFQAGIKTLANIDLLGNDNTFAVVTGQQLGLFTGPLYTIYKAITAVKLAQKLSNDFPEYNFVPIFWLEGEDHDFEEVNHVNLINSENEISRIEYLIGGKPLEKNIGAIGSITIDESFDACMSAIEASLPKTDYTFDLLSILKGYYKPGRSLLNAFAMFLNHIYEDSGLVYINPNVAEFKKYLSPLFLKEIQSNAHTSKLVIQKSAELEEHYHAQIKAKAVNLFMFHKGGRYLIEPSESGDYFLKNTRQRFTKEELLAIASSNPELLSPNVVTRPLCQDTLLPTVAYVSGPAETAYFAQLKPVYQYFSVPMPIIFPRASVTLVEEKIQKVLEKYSLEIHSLFGELDSIIAKVSEQVAEVKVDALFSALEIRINEAITEARFGIQQIDPTLLGTVDGVQSKFRQFIDVLQQKTRKAQQQKEDISLKQIRKASMNIFPNGNFQEREFTVLQYLNKYGPDFVKWVSNEISIERHQHQVITL
jgi:bacillithiol biosynthesis cysteine-adding enzyme BshC